MIKTINTLFLGNGLNLLEGAKNWNTLLTGIAFATGGRGIIDNVPNTLQYESIMLHTDYSSYATLEDADGRVFVDSDGKILKTIVISIHNCKIDVVSQEQIIWNIKQYVRECQRSRNLRI